MSGSNTTTSTSGPPPQVLQAYQNLTGAASNLASTNPLQFYGGPMVAGFTPQQQQGFADVSQLGGIGTPYVNAAAQEFGAATTPLWPTIPQLDSQTMGNFGTYGNQGLQSGTFNSANASSLASNIPGSVSPYQQMGTNYNVGTYLSPYTQNVTNALTNLFNNQNATQQQQVAGNATTAGAYGGDREAVAQALTAQQENLAQAPTLANTLQSGFQQAQQESNTQQGLGLQAGQLGLGANQAAIQGWLGSGQLGLGTGQAGFGEFNNQQQQQLAAEQANAWLESQAGFGMGGLGTEAMNLGLTGANANLSAGALQQQLAQEQLNIPEQQFQAEQAYPYQQLGFLAPVVEGTGSLSGGIGSTTSPGPSALSQVAGLGIAGTGVLGATGAFGDNGYLTNLFGGGGGGAAGSGDFSGEKRGGRIGYAGGGMTAPGQIPEVTTVPGLGGIGGAGGIGGGMGSSVSLMDADAAAGVPSINLNFIPQGTGGIGGKSPLGLSPFQPNQSVTQSSDPGVLGILGPVASIAKFAAPFFAKQGGRIGYDSGGTATGSGGIGAPANPAAPLPPIPKVNIDYIVAPGPVSSAAKGSGPPRAPQPQQQQDNPIKDAEGALGQTKGLKGLFGGDSSGSDADSSGSKVGGRIGFDAGGTPGYGGMAAQDVPLGIAAQEGGASPNVTAMYKQLQGLPLEKLQQMAVQYPPNSQQGQMVAMALKMKQATPGAGTAQGSLGQQAPIASPSSAPSAGGVGGGTAQAAQSPDQYGGTAQAGMAPQQFGGTAYPMMADGGDTSGSGYVTEDELDPHPVVDHSGKTVVLRFPSEGKNLDLGIPSIPQNRFHFAAGGTGPANNAPIAGTGPGTNFTSMPTANGVAIPQLNGDTFGANNPLLTNGSFAPGGGLGNWMQPMAQYQPPGTSTANGVLQFPETTGFTPGMQSIFGGYNMGAGLPVAFGGAPPAPAGAASNAGVTPAEAALMAQLGITQDFSTLTPGQQMYIQTVAGQQNATPAPSGGGDSSGGGGKRGGNVMHFDAGGDTDTSAPAPSSDEDAPPSDADYKALGIAPPKTGLIGFGAPPGSENSPGFTQSWPVTKVEGGTDIAQQFKDIAAGDIERNAQQKAAGNPWQAISGDTDTKPAPKTITLEKHEYQPAFTPKPEPGSPTGTYGSGFDKPAVAPTPHAPAPAGPSDTDETPIPAKLPTSAQVQGIGANLFPPGGGAAPAPQSTSVTDVASNAPAGNGGIGKPATLPPARQWVGVGDSLAGSLIGAGQAHGSVQGLNERKKNNNTDNPWYDASPGRTPQETLNSINYLLKTNPDYYKGPDGKGLFIRLSPGTSNDPNQINLIPQIVDKLKGAGAAGIQLVGVGDHHGFEGGKEYDLSPYNAQLKTIADNEGIGFTGPLKNTVVHPNPSSWASVPPDAGQGGIGTEAKSPDTVISGNDSQALAKSPAAQNVQKAINALRESGASNAFVQAALNQPFYEGQWATNWKPGDPDRGGSYGHLQFNYKPGSQGPAYDAWLKANQGDADPHDTALQFKFLASRVPPEILHGNDPKAITDWLNVNFENYSGAGPGQRYGHLEDAAKLMAGDYSALAHQDTTGVASTTEHGARTGSGGIGDDKYNVGFRTADSGHGGIGSNGFSSSDKNNPQYDTFRHRTLQERFKEEWPMLAIATGAGMLASRSPFPGVALGEGLKTGVGAYNNATTQENKEEVAQLQNQRLIEQGQRVSDQHQYQLGLLEAKQEAMLARQKAGDDSLDLKRQLMEGNQAIGLLKLQMQGEKNDNDKRIKEATLAEQKRLHDMQNGWHHVIGENGNMFYQNPANPGEMVDSGFKPQPHLTGQAQVIDMLTKPGPNGEEPVAKDAADALRIMHQKDRDPATQQKIEISIQNEARQMAGQDPANATNPEATLKKYMGIVRAQIAQHTVQPGATATPAAATAAPPAPPTGVPQGATGQRKNSDGSTTYWVPGTGEVTVPAAPH